MSELLSFPAGRYDNQVDALLLALDWYGEREPSLQPLDVSIDVDSFWRPSPWRMDKHPRFRRDLSKEATSSAQERDGMGGLRRHRA